MNTIKKIKFLILTLIGLLTINSCVKDDDFALPPVICNDVWVSNLTITELYDQVDAAGTILSFDSEQIFEGYVVSSDSTGNFFKTVSIQDDPENPTKALQVEMDRTNLFNNFPLGSKVKVNLNGIYAGYDNVLLKVGETYVDNGITRVGRMAENHIDNHVAITCDGIFDVTPVTFPDIASAKASGIINTLIKIENVQFSQTGVTYANAADHITTNLDIVGASAETNNQKILLRTSGYADFAGQIVPEGSGSITAVLSKYNSDWQLYIRDTNDVQFNNPRFGDGGGNGGGDNADYISCLNESFDAYDAFDTEFDSYFNVASEGSYYWQVKDFGSNKYIQMSAHNSGDASNVAYFIVPVNFSDADKFSFKSNDGFDNGTALSVYYSTDYTLGGDISSATLNDITSSFTISSGHTDAYGDTFVESGDYNLTSLSGNGAIVFKYQGSPSGVTTTIQLDDIKIVDNDDPDCGNGGSGGTTPTPPSENAVLAFAGADFENWATFESGINDFGIKPYATQSTGTGMDGSSSLHIVTDPTTTDGNDYVFTSLAYDGLPSSYTKIDFFVKGTSDKSVSLNVYKTDGTYYTFNLGTISSSQVISVAGNNQYTGTVNTGGQWIQVSLDLSGISDLNTTNTTGSFFALKIGKNANYDLHFDNFTIE